MKNPLRKRLFRELKSELGKYLVIFLLLTASIGFVSGFLVADGSMIIAYNESFEKYNIENGNFRVREELNERQRSAIEEQKVTLYDNYYVEQELSNDSTLRIFQDRKEVNKVCLMEGEMPGNVGEAAIDRMYAENNGLGVGDTLTSKEDNGGGKRTWKITGLVALPDYSCLFADNNDSMFDAVKFGVSVVTEDEFACFKEEELVYSYSWKYEEEPEDEKEEKEMAENLMKEIGKSAELEDFVPRYLNQAIQFTGEDMGRDRAMMLALLYIVIVIMAFVFGITVSDTISKEANVIGTLRASGYTRRELVLHYMAMPVFVTVAGALAGNVLGYTIFKNVCAEMYYGSYSLPTYTTVWSGEAFLLTTAVPAVLMLLINYIVLGRKLRLSPLKFLRRDLSRKKQKRALSLSPRIGIFHRFRLRIIFQNMSNYVVLFIGILFANLLLFFGLVLPSALAHYQEEMEEGMFCRYQYMLQVPAGIMSSESEIESMISMMAFRKAVETENEDAEKFSAYSLNTPDDGEYKSEEIMLYGIEDDSRYIPVEVEEDGVFISSGYAQKFLIKEGDTITLKEKYDDDEYSFKVAGIYEYTGTLSVFMGREELNSVFDLGDGYFNGYFSDTKITDIDEEYISSVIDIDDLTKISRQLDVSMGSMMTLVNGFAVVIFMALIYLLSKIIIEKNAQSISMAKILGYTNGEIGRLYIVSTSVMVAAGLLLSLPLEYKAMEVIFREVMLSSISGWITYWVDPVIYVKMFLTGMATYAVVAALEYRKVKRVPMDEALKNVE